MKLAARSIVLFVFFHFHVSAADFTISEFSAHCTTTEWHEEKSSLFSSIRVPVQRDQITLSKVVMSVEADNASGPQEQNAVQKCGNDTFLEQSFVGTPSLGPIPQKNFADALKICVQKSAPKVRIKSVFYSVEGGCK